jgi:hypothetical protein
VASRFPSGDRTLLRVRMRAVQDRRPQPVREDPLAPAGTAADPHAPAIAITDTGGRVLMTNAPFTALVGLDVGAVTDEHSLGEWLSDWPTILADVRRNGFMQLVTARLTRSSGEVTAVTVSCALLSAGEDERFGFTLRPLEAAAA